MTLPIDLIPNTNPPRFQWKQRVTTPIGDKVIDHEGTLPPMLEEAVYSLIAQTKQLASERDELQKFKNWVHKYLDDHGVPHHPPGTHGAAGCRIGDRMDWLMEKLREVESKDSGTDSEQTTESPPRHQPTSSRKGK